MVDLWERSHGAWMHELALGGITCERSVLELPEASGRIAHAYFQSATARACVLLLHGTGNDALFAWDLWIERLTQAGYAVLAADIEGHGKFSSTRLSPETFTFTAAALQRRLAELGWREQQVIACGYSLGALFAAKALSDGQLRAAGLITIALPRQVKISWDFALAEGLSFVHPVFWRQWWKRGWQLSVPALGPWRRRSFPLRLHNFASRSYPQCVAALFRLYAPRALLPRIPCPIFAIYGSRDRLAPLPPPAERDRGVETLLVAGANHFLLTWYPEGVEGALRWLERQAAAEASGS